MPPRRTADDLLGELRSLALMQYVRMAELLTTDHRGNIDGAWLWMSTGLAEPQWVPTAKNNLDTRHLAQRLASVLKLYAEHPDHERARLVVAPRWPRCLEVALAVTPALKVCPQCGANDGDGTGKLDGMLASWQDPTGSGWQCLNPECHWQSEDDLIE